MTTDITFSGAHHWLERHAGWLTLVTTLWLAGSIVGVTTADFDLAPSLVALGAFLLSVILLFTRPLTLESDINTIFRFSWGFAVAIAIFGTLFGYFGLGGFDDEDEKKKENEQEAAATAPDRPLERKPYLIALVRGCDYDSIPFVNGTGSARTSSSSTAAAGTAASGSTDVAANPAIRVAGRLTNPSMPEHIYCGELPPQWVLSIGGNILTCHFDGTCPKALPRPDIEKLEAEYAQANAELAAQRAVLATARRQLAVREGFTQLGLGAPEAPAGDYAAVRDTAAREVASLTPKVQLLKTKLDAAHKWDQFHWNIEGSPIVGGVVMPVYFLAIAVLGALVNMTRKLPEFQQRVDPAYPDEFKKLELAGEKPLPPLSPARARDLTVFQILQVLTAPAIAVLAYSWAKPEEIATTVILAFAAGFSSEVFLVAIRAVVDRAIGLGPRPTLSREAADALAKGLGPPLPPRGSGQQVPSSSGDFKAGSHVTLVKPVGPLLAGATGVVVSIEPGGELIVRSLTDHTGMPAHFRLQSQPPESFRLTEADPADTDNEPSG